MGAWMEYLHMQKPIPSNAKGVDVSIDVIDQMVTTETLELLHLILLARLVWFGSLTFMVNTQ